MALHKNQQLKKKSGQKRGKSSPKILGQKTALEMIQFFLNFKSEKTHLFCVGPKGVGRTSLTKELVQSYALKQKQLHDWVYVANFEKFSEPIALPLPVGEGKIFSQEMLHAIEKLKLVLKTTFSQETYHYQLRQIEESYQEPKTAFLENLNQTFLKKGVSLVQTEKGLGLSPFYQEKILSAEEFNALPIATRQKILPQLKQAQKQLAAVLKNLPNHEEEKQRQIQQFNTSLAAEKITLVLNEVLRKITSSVLIENYFKQAQNFLLKNLQFLFTPVQSEALWAQLMVNPFVCHTGIKSLPVIHLNQVSLCGLLGCLQKTQKESEPLHMQIEAGALHQANGGFLILEASDLGTHPEVWAVLKQALFTQKISMVSPMDTQNLCSARSVFPASIPLQVKVILVGSREVYESFKSKDEDFAELFKLRAEFLEQMPRTKINEKDYLLSLMSFAQKNNLLPFDVKTGPCLVDYASRLCVEGKEMLTLHLSQMHDLMRSADFYARQSKSPKVQEKHLMMALDNAEKATRTVQDEWLTAVKRGLISLSVKGQKIGQINTLSVCHSYEKRLGRMARLTCTLCAGNGVIQDIEKQINFGGPVHSKGMMILGAYLKSHYGQKEPLKLDLSLSFEQSYGPIEGDSASLAELSALLSAIGQIPVAQTMAVTGSVNQFGQVQAVGGINDKIEGFFDVCHTLGFSANQGVIFPKVCLPQLVLKQEIQQAIQKGKFHLYPVETVDECMEILTGLNKKAVDQKITTAWHNAYINCPK